MLNTAIAALAGFALGFRASRNHWRRHGARAALRMWRDIADRRRV